MLSDEKLQAIKTRTCHFLKQFTKEERRAVFAFCFFHKQMLRMDFSLEIEKLAQRYKELHCKLPKKINDS